MQQMIVYNDTTLTWAGGVLFDALYTESSRVKKVQLELFYLKK